MVEESPVNAQGKDLDCGDGFREAQVRDIVTEDGRRLVQLCDRCLAVRAGLWVYPDVLLNL